MCSPAKKPDDSLVVSSLDVRWEHQIHVRWQLATSHSEAQAQHSVVRNSAERSRQLHTYSVRADRGWGIINNCCNLVSACVDDASVDGNLQKAWSAGDEAFARHRYDSRDELYALTELQCVHNVHEPFLI